MSDGRTVWLAKDSAWWRREAVIEMLEEVGPVGPAVVDWLSCEAKVQNQGGAVKTGYRSIARGLCIDLVTVCPLVSLAVSVGLLDDFEEDGRTFTCRISGWASEQERAIGAAKKRRQRAGATEESPANEPDSTTGHDGTCPVVSPPVPLCPEMSPTGQDRTVQVQPPSEVALDARPEVVALSHRLADSISRRDPSADVAPDGKGWLDAIRLLLDSDKRTAKQVEYVIDWLAAGASKDALFWQGVVLSAPKLRAKFTQLVAVIQREGAAVRPVSRNGDLERWLQRTGEAA